VTSDRGVNFQKHDRTESSNYKVQVVDGEKKCAVTPPISVEAYPTGDFLVPIVGFFTFCSKI
jgi:hypothetical protein